MDNKLKWTGTTWCAMGSASSHSNANDKLLVYSHQHSFYARKVLMTLEEKNIEYNVKVVDLTKGEQYSPWFISINHKGEVPVLKDGSTIVIDSKVIIDYLDDGYSQGDYISLIPKDVDDDIRKKTAEMRTAIDAMEGNMLSFGLLYHPEFIDASDKHYPYNVPGITGAMKGSVVDAPDKLRALASKNPAISDVLMEKAAGSERTKKIVQSKEEFEKVIQSLEALFLSLEQELAVQSGSDTKWLTGDRFTQADVSLAILMDRIWRVGGAKVLWGQHSHLSQYFKQIQNRKSYLSIEPSIWTDLSTFLPYVAGLLALGVLLAAALVSIPFIIAKAFL